jgi:hypothetical protein
MLDENLSKEDLSSVKIARQWVTRTASALAAPLFVLVFACTLWVLWLHVGSRAVKDSLSAPREAASAMPGAPGPSATGSFRFRAEGLQTPLPRGQTPRSIAGDGELKIALVLPSQDKDVLAELGQAGDAFGGFNALMSALAFAAVFWAAYLQRATLKEVRSAEERSDAARRFAQAQESFFEMLKLSRELVHRIRVPQPSGERRRVGQLAQPGGYTEGVAALDSIAFSINKRAVDKPEAARLLEAVARYQRYYRDQPSRIGPYFRLLFQMFKLIDNSRIGDTEKLQLANIARGQLTEGTALLLALNALTWRGWAFVEYIEKYGLLEHMHPEYASTFRGPMEHAFTNHAFYGSRDRNSRPKLKPGDPVPAPTSFDASDDAEATRAEAAVWLKQFQTDSD